MPKTSRRQTVFQFDAPFSPSPGSPSRVRRPLYESSPSPSRRATPSDQMPSPPPQPPPPSHLPPEDEEGPSELIPLSPEYPRDFSQADDSSVPVPVVRKANSMKEGRRRRRSHLLYEERCGGTLLPFPSDREWPICTIDEDINLYEFLFGLNACARAVAVLARAAGHDAGAAKELKLGLIGRNGTELEYEVKYPAQHTAIEQRLREQEACCVVVSFFYRQPKDGAPGSIVGHAVIALITTKHAIIVDPNGNRLEKEDSSAIGQNLMRDVLNHVFERKFQVLVTPDMNFSPSKVEARFRDAGLNPPVVEREGYCFVISLILLFDTLCTNHRVAGSREHAKRLFSDLGNDKFLLFAYGRSFVTRLLRLMMHRLPLRIKPPWWDGTNRRSTFRDVRSYDDVMVVRDDLGIQAVSLPERRRRSRSR